MVLFLPDPSFGHFTRMGSIVLKLCIYALVDILITKMVFFLYKVTRKTRSKIGPLSRSLKDAVPELQPVNAIASRVSKVWVAVEGWHQRRNMNPAK